MNLLDIVQRTPVPDPWSEGEKIPWHEPAFSRRMLKEHLSQAHDAASRRAEIIDKHVAWLHHHVLADQPARILDLGCGPGLYASRLARLGHTCTGIDFSPASVEYAQQTAAAEGLACTYTLHDIRTADYGIGYGLAMLIFGEFNVFTPVDARTILRKANAALADHGILVLEPHTEAYVHQTGERPRSWYSAQSGLFSDEPYLCLEERFWDEGRGVATERYYIVDAASGNVTRYAASMQAYSDDAYRAVLAECGFGEIEFCLSLAGESGTGFIELFAIVARKIP